MNYPYIRKYIDKMRGQNNGHSSQLVLSAEEARGLHADITKLLLDLDLVSSMVQSAPNTDNTQDIELTGGSF
jgi:hypothetical protein